MASGKRRAIALCLFAGLLACGAAGAETGAAPGSRRVAGREADPILLPVPQVRITHPRIEECSGIVWLDGAWYAHNDSGDEPMLYRSPTLDFADAEALPVPGAGAVDWEDITLLEGDLLIGDIGDNRRRREHCTLYRARYAPDPAGGSGRLELIGAYPFRYPDGPHNAEALAVIDGRVHLVTKAGGGDPTAIYRFDELPAQGGLGGGRVLVPRRLGVLELGKGARATAADCDSANGLLVLLTTESIAYYSSAALAGVPRAQARVDAGKCEAICVRGADLILANEGREVFRIEDYLRLLDDRPARE